MFCTGILQAVAAGAHVPEIAAHKIALQRIVMKHRRERRVHITLWLSLTESRSHRSGIRDGAQIQGLNRASESGFRCVAETACLVLVDGKMLVEEQQLAQGTDLSLAIQRCLTHLGKCVGLDPIEVSDNPCNVLVEGGRHLPGTIISRRVGCRGRTVGLSSLPA